MNQALLGAIGMDPDIKLFDDFGLLNDVIADPGALACRMSPMHAPSSSPVTRQNFFSETEFTRLRRQRPSSATQFWRSQFPNPLR